MKLRHFTRTAYATVIALAACVTQFVSAGNVSNLIDLQVYNDFAMNKAPFYPGARNVPIYGKEGNYIGSIDRMMNFDCLFDLGYMTLVDRPNMVATCAHNDPLDLTKFTFTTRFGAVEGTPSYDIYQSPWFFAAWEGLDDQPSIRDNYDYRIQRLSKIVTEAEPAPILTDKNILDNMHEREVLRAGTGQVWLIDHEANTQEMLIWGYQYWTGGRLKLQRIDQWVWPDTEEDGRDPFAYETFTMYTYPMGIPSESNPLPVTGRQGDSGSPGFIYDDNTDAWYFIGTVASGGGDNTNAWSAFRFGPFWAVAVMDGFDKQFESISSTETIWLNPATEGTTAALNQSGNTVEFTALPAGRRGDTSTNGQRADNDALSAANNLILGGAGGQIVLGGSLDTGAGYLHFKADYTLSDGGHSGRTLNTAGYTVDENVTVTTTLTASAGDEWRKVGKGTLVISGNGANPADLNVGGKGVTILSRSGGSAVKDVRINGGDARVKTEGANQISGDIIFGHRGGTVDLAGNDCSLTDIIHLDGGAVFANDTSGTSTFTFTGEGTYQGAFRDGGAGILRVTYAPAVNGTWVLEGELTNSGGLWISGGEVVFGEEAVIATESVNIASAARLQSRAAIASHINVSAGGTLAVSVSGINVEGTVSAAEGAILEVNAELLEEGIRYEVLNAVQIAGQFSLALSGNSSGNWTLVKSDDQKTLILEPVRED